MTIGQLYKMEPPDENLDPKQFRVEEKSVDPGGLSLGRELSSGSENLNCKRIFGFAKLIGGSGNVGSAAKSIGSGLSDPDGFILYSSRESVTLYFTRTCLGIE